MMLVQNPIYFLLNTNLFMDLHIYSNLGKYYIIDVNNIYFIVMIKVIYTVIILLYN